MSSRPLIVATDVHLSRTGSGSSANALVELVEAASGHELVLAGDTFNLSEEPAEADPLASTVELLGQHAALRAALARHLAAGHPFTLLAGNHDAALANPEAACAIRTALGADDDAPLSVHAWFIRRGEVHIEHGHVHDPDNAPLHPLAPWAVETEPLGVSITRRFLVPSGALAFAHAHETTPMGGLIRAFQLFGTRAPAVVARYFEYALRQCVVSTEAVDRARSRGDDKLGSYAHAAELDVDLVRELARLAPRPTHARLDSTFRRLYLDRVSATLAVTAGAALSFAGAPALGAVTSAIGAGYLAASVARGSSRYRGVMEERLRRAAEAIAERSRARLVVFGHTHQEDEGGAYVNTGAFGYDRGRGRPYLRVETSGRFERRHLVGG